MFVIARIARNEAAEAIQKRDMDLLRSARNDVIYI
jgi:hypothetical protein